MYSGSRSSDGDHLAVGLAQKNPFRQQFLGGKAFKAGGLHNSGLHIDDGNAACGIRGSASQSFPGLALIGSQDPAAVFGISQHIRLRAYGIAVQQIPRLSSTATLPGAAKSAF